MSHTGLTDQIVESQKKRLIDNGFVPLNDAKFKPLPQSIRNWRAVLANEETVSICTSATPKTTTRYTAENSLISAMAFLCIVANIHYNISAEPQVDVKLVLNKTYNLIHFYAHGEDLRNYLIERAQWQPETFNKIAWPTFAVFYKKQSSRKQTRI